MIKASPKKILLAASCIVVVALFFWAGSSNNENLLQTDNLSTTPDYFITKIHATEFNQDGKLIETLTADKGLHYNKGAITLLENPKVKRVEKTGNWEAQGKKGIIEDGSSDILLTNDASAIKHYVDSPDITLKADNIRYLDEGQSLTSTGNAKVYSTQGETSADVIVTYINTEEIKMTGSVRGQYEATH